MNTNQNTITLVTISDLDLAAVHGGFGIGGLIDGAGRVLSTVAHDAGIGAGVGAAGGAAVGLFTGPGMAATSTAGGAGGALLGGAFGLGRAIGNEIKR
jgi:hypothetical protein